MSNVFRLVLALTVVCIVAALCLSIVNGMTRALVDDQDREAELRAVRAVLPAFDHDPITDTQMLEMGIDGRENARQIQVYSGMISMILGVHVNGHISGVYILKHAETPGLGAKIEQATFRGVFKGKSWTNSKRVRGDLAVKKDGGDIDAITGATISSRGVTAAVSRGLKLFEAHKQALFQ